MKTKFLKFIDKIPKNVMLCTISGLLLISVVNMYTLKVGNDVMNDLETGIKDNVTDSKIIHISSLMDLGYKVCEQSTDLLAKKLENELMVNYDLSILKQEFENSILSDKFYDSIKNVLNVKTDENELFSREKITMVATKNGIIAEFSNYDTQIESNNKILSWEEYVNNSINPQLTNDALEMVLSNKNKIAFIQKAGNITLEKADVSKLIDMYINNGKEILDDYYFITASYITEDGDIFGTDDKTFLASNDNYKLIVLNAISIREVMDLFESQIISIDNQATVTLTKLDGYHDIMTLTSVIGNICIFLVAISLACLYNKKISEGDDE